MGTAASMSDHIRYNHFSEFVKSSQTIDPVNLDLEGTFEHYSTRKGFIPLKDALDLMKRTDLYLSFDRGFDEVGKKTFDRVNRINESLKVFGFSSCFIGEYMEGDFMEKMRSGVDNTALCVIVVTKRFISRLMSMDVCYKEFKYMQAVRGPKNVFFIVMDSSCRDFTAWPEAMRVGLEPDHVYSLTKGEEVADCIDKCFNHLLNSTQTLWIRRKGILPYLVPITKSRFEDEFNDKPLADQDQFTVPAILALEPVKVEESPDKFTSAIEHINYSSALTEDEISEIVQSFHMCRMQTDKMKSGLKCVKSLREHTGIPVIVEHAIRTVWFLSNNNEDISTSFGNLGICRLICNALKIYVNNFHVVEEACKSIWILAYKNEANKKSFEEGGICEILPAALNIHKDSPHIVDSIMKAICYIATSDFSRSMLGSYRCCEVVVACLEQHILETNVVSKACRAIAHLCVKHTSNQNKLAAAGACSLISTILVQYMSSVSIVDEGLGAMWNIIFNNDQGKVLMGESNGCQAVMLALTTYPNISTIVEQCSICISNLSSTHSINRWRLGQEGVCELLVPLIAKYISNTPVLEKLSKAVHNLAFNDDLNQHRFGQSGGCHRLIEALKLYTEGQPSTLERLCEPFITLAAHSDNATILSSTDIAAVLVTALNTNMKHETVVDRICGCIRNVSSSDVIRNDFYKANVIICFKTCLMTYSGNPSIIAKAITCLVILCDSSDRARSLSNSGGMCELVVSILLKHISVVATIDLALQFIQKLCMDVNNQKKFGKNNGCKAIVNALITHHQLPAIVEKTCGSISCMALHQANHVHFVDIQLCSFLAKIVHMNIYNATIINNAVHALHNMTFNDEIQALCGNTGVCEAVCKALGVHIANAEIVEVICDTIANLSFDNERNALILADSGACILLASVIKKHFHSLSILKLACHAIQNVMTAEDNQVKCQVSGCCEAITMTLSHYYTDQELCEAALSALQNISSSILIASYLGKIGACEATCMALQTYMANIETTKLVLNTMNNLSIDIENQIYFGRCGACELLVQVMMKYIRDSEVIRIGLQCMTNLSILKDNQVGLGRNGGCEMLLKIMIIHPNLANNCNAARANMSYKNEENRIKLRVLAIGGEKFDTIYNFSFQSKTYEIGFNVGDDPVFAARRFIEREPDFAPYQSNIVEWLMEQILIPVQTAGLEAGIVSGGHIDSDDD